MKHASKKKILHIGNVANYAYNIGKVLQSPEVESHAISWDYYHINAQPIWEEGEFDPADIGDHFFPKLPSPTGAGFKTPVWYFQGPCTLACLALIARNEGKHVRAAILRRALDRHLAALHDPTYRTKMANGRQRLIEIAFMQMLGGFARTYPSFSLQNALRSKAAVVRAKIGRHVQSGRLVALQRAARLPRPVKRAIRLALGRGGAPVQPHLRSSPDAQQAMLDDRDRAAMAGIAPPLDIEVVQAEPSQAVCEPPAPEIQATPFEAHVQALIAQYKSIYPDRSFDPELLRQFEHLMPLMRRLFSHYDVIIGYAIEGIWPLMAGVPYVAYEFGTIRNLPFEDSPTGRLAMLTYSNCEQTIVTNADNERPAEKLGRPYFFLPHVVNEDGLLRPEQVAAARQEFLARHGGDFIVFHPPRQHWDERRDTNWDKGNDHLFRGFARLVETHAPDARCVAVAWGDTLPRSRQLIDELGITENVIWITPQPHKAMMRYIAICDVVCDQFTIPTFGGIPPKAFNAGKPVMTAFDPALHEWCFDELPPLIPGNSPEAIYDALAGLYKDRDAGAELGRKGADWYRRENSNARVREVLLAKMKGI